MDTQTLDSMITAARKCGSKLARQAGLDDPRDCQQVGVLAVLEGLERGDCPHDPAAYAVSRAWPAIRTYMRETRSPVRLGWRDAQAKIDLCDVADEPLPAETRTPEAQLDRDHAGAEAAALLEGLVGNDPVRRAVVSVLLEDCGRAEAQAHAGVGYVTFGEAERALRRRVRFDPRARDCWDRLAGN